MNKIPFVFDSSQPPRRKQIGFSWRQRIALLSGLILVFLLVGYWLKYSSVTEVGNDNSTESEHSASSEATSTNNNSNDAAVPAPGLSATQETLIGDMKKMLEKGEYVDVRKKCYDLLKLDDCKSGQPFWRPVVDVLSEANIKIFMTDVPFADKKETYKVVKNDSLDRISRKFNTTVEAVQISNKLSLQRSIIHPGQVMRIYKGNWLIKVNKDKNMLVLYDGDDIFKVYSVGIGRQNRTPLGKFKVTVKTKEPKWYSPDGKIFEFGSSQNILGTRWMALTPFGDTDDKLRGYGIHGTWSKGDITNAESNGCIRMLNADVEELFTIIPHLTVVEIE